MRIDTICIHSDTPGADRIAGALRAGLHAVGISVERLDVADARGGCAGEALRIERGS